MRGFAALPAALVALAVLAAGCFGPAAPPPEPPAPEAPAARLPAPADYLAALQVPARPDARRCVADVEAFAAAAPRRHENLSDHEAARQWIERELAAAGLAVSRHGFTGTSQTQQLPMEGHTILGTLPGRDPSLPPIVLGAHMDNGITSHGGAYDNGSGSMVVVELARALAQSRLDRTLVFALWDLHESGLQGSEAYVRDLAGADVAFYLNFDMVGLNWPAKMGGVLDVALGAGFGGPDDDLHADLWTAVVDHLGHPEEARYIRTGGPAGSDDTTFVAAGHPTVGISGTLTATYHNADGFDALVAHAGGDRAALEGGFDTALQSSFLFVHLLDAYLGPAA